ncbi:MAG: hypothetical protein D6B27_01860 [Gammaproteobacteria bacterium]|nr:MAG: hypothetical protein D6B27_01860 [Gammaproteobacteria bacterium]
MYKYIKAMLVIITPFSFIYAAYAESPPLPRSVQLSVSEIFIENEDSIKKVIGTIPKPAYSKDYFLGNCVLNADKSEILILEFHSGNTAGNYSEFTVRNNQNENAKCLEPLAKIEHFKTESGIHLGISPNYLYSILGKPNFVKEKKKQLQVRYVIEDDKSSFLESYNMPVYYGEYYFKDNSLLVIKFGFEYP